MKQSNSLPVPESKTATSPQGTSYTLYGADSAVSGAHSPLVFIHGVGLNQAAWQYQVEEFAEHYPLVTYDMLGHGGSPLPPAPSALEDYASQLFVLLEHLNIRRVHIIGHSMGALVGMAFALAYPSRVISIVALNIVYQRNEAQREAVLKRAEIVSKSRQITGIKAALDRWFKNEVGADVRQKIARVQAWLEGTDPVGYARSYQLFAQSDRACTGRLSQLTMPVLYLTGGQDPNSTEKMSRQMASETPKGHFESLEDAAHMMAYINADKVNPLINQFLSKIAQSQEVTR